MNKEYLNKEGLQRVWRKILNNFLTKNEAASLVPTKVSSFENDANYISEGANVSLLENDANYQSANQIAAAISEAVANLIAIGDNVSNLENDASYQTQTQVADAIASAIRDVVYKFDNISSLTNDMNYQTLTQVVGLINNAIGEIVSLRFDVVEELPEIGLNGVIYLVPKIYTEDDLWIESDMAKDDIFMTAIERTLFKTNKAFNEYDIVNRNSRDLTKLDFESYVDTTSLASRDFSIDEYFLDGPTLYVVIDDISEGDSFIVNTNIESVTYTQGISTITSHPYENGDVMLIGGKGYDAKRDMPSQTLLWSTSDVSRDYSIDANKNIYIEWYYTPDTKRWEIIGSTSVDLTGYYTKEETDELIAANAAEIQEVANDLSGLQTQVNGLVDLFYPVGSIYMSTVDTNPGTRFAGTTWVAWGSGKVPVGVDANDTDFNTVEKTGGAKSHSYTPAGTNDGTTLTAAQCGVPAHSHGLNSHTHTVGAHSHGLNSHTHTVGAHSHGLNSHVHSLNNHTHGMTHNHGIHGIKGLTNSSRALWRFQEDGNLVCVRADNAALVGHMGWSSPSSQLTSARGVMLGQDSTESDGAIPNSSKTSTNGPSTTNTGAASGSTANSTAFASGAATGNTANSTAFASGAATGNTANNTATNASESHTHTFTGTASTQSHVQPYITCYMWKRTA